MKIIKVSISDRRTALQVTLNPDDPQWVHVVGEALLDADGQPIVDATGEPRYVASPDAPPEHTGDTVEAQAAGRVLCHNCRLHWIVQEHTWQDEERYTADADGQQRWKTDDELLAELRDRVAAAERQPTVSPLLGRIIDEAT